MNRRKLIKAIGHLCRVYRKDAKYTQQEIANAVHCVQSNVSQFENGIIDSEVLLAYYIYKFDIDINCIYQIYSNYGDY